LVLKRGGVCWLLSFVGIEWNVDICLPLAYGRIGIERHLDSRFIVFLWTSMTWLLRSGHLLFFGVDTIYPRARSVPNDMAFSAPSSEFTNGIGEVDPNRFPECTELRPLLLNVDLGKEELHRRFTVQSLVRGSVFRIS
jgi:hypothetical protein